MINSEKFVCEQVERFKDAILTVLVNVEDVLLVALDPNCSGWGICYFIFTKRIITCYGDIQSFTLETTWNARQKILNGDTPESIGYLLSKMANGRKIQQFEHDLFNERIGKIYNDYTDSKQYSKQEISRFKKLFNENKYLLNEVCEGHLTPFDNWCDEIGILDSWEYYNSFYDYPVHAYIMIAMIFIIESKLEHMTKED